ncbi:MAG: lactate racemase domain-containing protein, partial [Acidobacteriota bacterium]
MSVAGRGLVEGYLGLDEITRIVREGLASRALDGQRVLVLIPDGTRTMPMPMMFDILERELAPRVAALDYLVALGTHIPMDDAHLSRLIGRA